MKIAPTAPTIHWPPGQLSAPAVDECALPELLELPSSTVTARMHIAV